MLIEIEWESDGLGGIKAETGDGWELEVENVDGGDVVDGNEYFWFAWKQAGVRSGGYCRDLEEGKMAISAFLDGVAVGGELSGSGGAVNRG